MAALYVTLLILITQRHDDELATRREQLTLELAILNERKAAKIIAMLEESRFADPMKSSDRDVEAETLATATDPETVFDALKSS